MLTAGMAFMMFNAGALTSLAQEGHEGFTNGTAATVTSVTGKITAVNYNESGAAVNGFLVGTNVLLTFSKPVCGVIASLGKVGDSVTYSGVAVTLASGLQVVHVTSYTDGSITYPPAAPPKPAAYSATKGTITQLNYSEYGSVNGFLFTPTSGSEVFVNVGRPSTDLATALTANAAVTVTGTLEAPPACAPTGSISEVDASSLTIGTTTYPIPGMGMGHAFGWRH